MLASTITTIIVFFPVMFLFGVAKYLFSALALAVVLSMIGVVRGRDDASSRSSARAF